MMPTAPARQLLGLVTSQALMLSTYLILVPLPLIFFFSVMVWVLGLPGSRIPGLADLLNSYP